MTNSAKDPNHHHDDEHIQKHTQIDSAKQDAVRLRQWYPLPWVIKIAMGIFLAILLILLVLYYAVGTATGTKKILEIVSQQTGMRVTTGDGNLRDGLWLYDLSIVANPPDSYININVDKAFVKIGWRAILSKEIHLRQADIGQIDIHNLEPSTDTPFAYKTVALPVNLRFDDAKIAQIRYQQSQTDPIFFNNIAVTDLQWLGSKIMVNQGTISYGDIQEKSWIAIDNLSGKIDLQQDYPLDIKANIEIKPLSKIYFSPLSTHITGSLKQTMAAVTADYHHSPIVGNLTVNPMLKNVPFQADLTWQDVLLPYASEQNIRLKNGSLNAKGNIDNIVLNLDTRLTAKAIPDGKYRGIARTDGKKMLIDELSIQLPEGELVTQGQLDWQQRFAVSLTGVANDFSIRQLLSDDIAPYAPEKLQGNLSLQLQVADHQNPMQIQAKLQQQDGEILEANINQADGEQQPMNIMVNWQNLIRQNLPDIQQINSPKGNANLMLSHDNQNMDIDLSADIQKLAIAPQGDYQLTLNKKANQIAISKLNYQGVAGDLNMQAKVTLPYVDKPLIWQIDAKTQQFDLQKVDKNIPLNHLTGELQANGSMAHIRQHQGKRLTRHLLELTNIQMLANILDRQGERGRRLKLQGTGDGKIDINQQGIVEFASQFHGNLNVPNMANGQLIVDVAGTPKKINIHQFEHQGEVGQIFAKGQLDLTQGLGWQIETKMNQFDASYFLPDLPSQITGDVVSQGNWQDKQQSIKIDKINLTGNLKNQPLTAQGKLLATLHLPKNLHQFKQLLQKSAKNIAQPTIIQQLQVDNLVLAWGKNRLQLQGDEQKLVSSVDISTLHQLDKKLRGNIKGGIVLTQDNLQGKHFLPNIFIDLVGRDIALPNFVVLDGQITGKILDLAQKPSQLQLDAKGVSIYQQPLKMLQIDFSGTQQEHMLDFVSDSQRGKIQASLNGKIDFAKQTWQGIIANGQVGTMSAQLRQQQPAQLLLNWQQPKVQLAGHCWQMVQKTGKLCLKENLIFSNQLGQIDVDLQQVSSQIFSILMPKDLAWVGSLNGNVKIDWRKHQSPVINTHLYSDNGKFGSNPQTPDELPMLLAYDRVSLIARSVKDGLKLRADIKTSKGTGNGYLDAVIDPTKEHKPIQGDLVFQDINLTIFKSFFPAFDKLTGYALVAGKINGTLSQPKFVGDVEIQDAQIALTGVPVKLNEINILTNIQGNQAKIDGSFKSGDKGHGKLTGTVDWQKALQAKLKLQGEQVVVSQPPLIFAEINPIFDVIVKPQQKFVQIEGVIDVPKATIRPPEATANVIGKSGDVVVIDRRLAGQLDDVLKVTTPWSIYADIGVDLGKQLSFNGFGAKLPLAGALNLTQKGQGNMKAEGVVQVAKRSKVDVFGQSLNISHAQVRFNGAMDKPNVNIEASQEIQGVLVGVRVRGHANDPNITVFNNGGLSELQAMNALLTGSINNTGQNTNTEDFRTRVNNTLAAAGLNFGFSGTRQLTDKIGKAFGLQSLTLGAAGAGNDTEVNITGYITPDLYIRYGVGAFNANRTLSMRYQLTQRLYIEAKSATSNVIDLIYHWKF